MESIDIVTEHVPGGENETETWQYRRDTGGWWVRKAPEDDGADWPTDDGDNGWEQFASASAPERTVEQLLRKEHSTLY